MTRFLRKSLIYVIPLMLFAFWADQRIRKIPNNYSYKHFLFSSFPPSHIDTLILGSSHTFKGINPAYFGAEAFNYAHVSQSFDIDLAILESIRERKNLKTLILPVSLFSFFSILGEGVESHRLTNYQIYTDLKIEGSIFQKSGLNNWINYRHLALYPDSSSITITDKGWENMKPCISKQQLERTSQIAFARHSKHQSTPNQKAIEAFNAIIQFCERNRVSLILVTMPAHEDYRELAEKTEHWKVTQEIIKDVLNQKSDVDYINYFETDLNLNTHDYHDADHLSEAGAEKLSNDLAHRIANN